MLIVIITMKNIYGVSILYLVNPTSFSNSHVACASALHEVDTSSRDCISSTLISDCKPQLNRLCCSALGIASMTF